MECEVEPKSDHRLGGCPEEVAATTSPSLAGFVGTALGSRAESVRALVGEW